MALQLPTAALAAPREVAPTVDAALKQARREHLPVFVEFQASWCGSCSYMATHVFNGPEWETAGRHMHVVEIDADSPEGATWMKRLAVKGLPSYVVLKPDGSELGRLTAEQPRERFYPALDRILAGGDVLGVLKAKARRGSPAAVADVLESFQARGEYAGALAWYATLPGRVRAVVADDAKVSEWLTRLRFDVAALARNESQCAKEGALALAGNVGCDRAILVETLIACLEKMPRDQARNVLAPQRSALESLLSKQVFADPPVCSDQGTAVMASADLYKALDDKASETAVLDHAIDNARKVLGDDYAKDRNLADDLRIYLNRAGREVEADSLMPKLIAAFPDDFVYPYRYARKLLDRHQPAQALPYFEDAARKSYGWNRLLVATYRVKALLALNRRADAERVVADALEANGRWFPEDVATLKAALKG